jgi:repressor LexA
MNLTRRQSEVFEFIKTYFEQNGMTPQTIEIQENFGYSANSTVIGHLQALEKKGLIRRFYKQKRSIELVGRPRRSIPIRGVIPAGFLLEVFEQYDEMMIPEGIIRKLDETYALRVEGESMIEEHILDGDIILIEERSYAENGQIAVVCHEGKTTLKKFYLEKDHIRLQPANSSMDPIKVRGDVFVLGVMVGLIRDLN